LYHRTPTMESTCGRNAGISGNPVTFSNWSGVGISNSADAIAGR
jgi:hypothetical protein